MHPLFESLSRVQLLVVGDVMLDRYWFGDVHRISPEAPVPIVRVRRTEERLGGAGNVARNAASLGARTRLLSVVGNDEAGQMIARLAKLAQVEASLFVDAEITTTVKLRILGVQQQLLRVDFEATPSHEVLGAKLDEFERTVAAVQAVVLSDYGKGGLSHVARMISAARSAGKPVFVDPKGDDYSRFAGATVVTPNRAELRQVVGDWRSEEELRDKAQALRERLSLQALLVTRSEEGMTLYTADGVMHESAQAREVFDVSGAGDTVIATLAAAHAAGADWASAVRAANAAGGIVVGKLGTAVIEIDELKGVLEALE
jgi:rfaE bifunctional protein kinase chain/domain